MQGWEALSLLKVTVERKSHTTFSARLAAVVPPSHTDFTLGDVIGQPVSNFDSPEKQLGKGSRLCVTATAPLIRSKGICASARFRRGPGDPVLAECVYLLSVSIVGDRR